MGDMSVLILDLGPLKASYPRLDGIQRRLRGWAGGSGRGGDRRPMGQPVPSLTRPWTGNGVLDRFLEDESLFGEFLRTPVSEGGVEPLVVGPPHVVVEVGA